MADKRAKFAWDEEKTATFLDTLAATCNVSAAARAIGVQDVALVYKRRRRDAEFVAAWGDALALGYQMLETQLVGHALAGGADADPLDGGACAAVNVELALKLLKEHRDRPGKPKGGRPPSYAAPEDTNQAILAKLDQLEKARALKAARGAGKERA